MAAMNWTGWEPAPWLRGNESAAEAGSVVSFTSKVHLFLLPVLILVGIVGNSMAILLVRTNSTLKRLPSNTYLGVLASSSLVFLLVLAYQWLEAVTGWDYWNRSPFLCKTLTWLGHCCDFASAWLVVLLSVERTIVLFRFHHRHRFCNLLAAQRVILILWAFTMSFNSWVLFLANITHPSAADLAYMGLEDPSDVPTYCGVLGSDERAYAVLLGLETVLGMIIPATIITTTNLILVCKLHYYRRFLPMSPSVRFHRPSKDTLESGNPETQGFRTEVGLSGATTLTQATGSDLNGGTRKRRVRPSDLRLTRTLLVLTSLFIILNLPTYVFRCMDQFAPQDFVAAPPLLLHNITSAGELAALERQLAAEQDATTWIDVFKLIAFLLSYAHHAGLFYIYIFYSPQMKKQLKPMAMKLLECDCLKPVPGLDIDSI